MLCYKFNNQWRILAFNSDLFANLKYKNRFDNSKRFYKKVLNVNYFFSCSFSLSVFLTVSYTIDDATNMDE